MKPKRTLVPLNTSQRSVQENDFASRADVRIIGQSEAKAAALRAYRSYLNPLRDLERPIYIIKCIGKSRTGKTLTAETLAELLHGDKKALVRINCGAYKEKHRISQLLGAPPGYVGFKDDSEKGKPGQIDRSAKLSRDNLIASRRGSKVPVTIVLVDECEKMTEELEDVFLSIFDKGEVDLGNNEPADFRDCIFVLTSNLASDEVERLGRPGIGFHAHAQTPSTTQVKDTVTSALEKRYKPEFLNRIDEIVIFAAHTPEQIKLIVDAEIGLVEERIMNQLPRGLQFGLEVEESARQFLLDHSKNGVADLKRTIQRYMLDPVSSELIKRSIKLGDVLVVKHESGKDRLSFYIAEGEAAISDAEHLSVADTRATQNGLGFQRAVEKANYKAARSKRATYDVTVRAEDIAQLAEVSQPLTFDMLNIFGLQLLETASTWSKPFVFKAAVLGIAEQIELLKKKYPEVEVALRGDANQGAS